MTRGKSQPYIGQTTLGDDCLSALIAVNAAATAEVVAAPGAGKQIWWYSWVVTPNVAGTYSFLSAATPKSGVLGATPNQANGASVTRPYKCGTNEALNIAAVTANFAGSLVYEIVKVA